MTQDLENLLLLFRQESEVIYVGGRGSDVPVERKAKEEDTAVRKNSQTVDSLGTDAKLLAPRP